MIDPVTLRVELTSSLARSIIDTASRPKIYMSLARKTDGELVTSFHLTDRARVDISSCIHSQDSSLSKAQHSAVQ